MITFLDNIIRPCAEKSRLWLIGTIALAVLSFVLAQGTEELGARPTEAADTNLLAKRNCLEIVAFSDRLSSEDLAKIVKKYSPDKNIGTPPERSAAIGPLLELEVNSRLKCGDSTEESQSLCFKDRERKFCLPLN